VRAAIVFSVFLGVASAASAESQPFDVPGDPRAVDVWRPGVFSVATTEVAQLWDEGALTGNILNFFVYGTFLSPSGCFVAVHQDGTQLIQPAGCLPSGNISPDNPNVTQRNVQRVRTTPSGTGYAMLLIEGSELELLTSLGRQATQAPWNALTVNDPRYLPTTVMGVTDTDGGTPHALFHVRSGPSELLWFRGRDLVSEVDIPPSLTTGALSTVDLFATGGPHPVALIGNADGLFRGQLTPPQTSTPIAPFSRVTVQGAPVVSIASVDVNTGGGSERGEGYGLAVGTLEDGSYVVLGAVPADSAADAGTLWRIHPAFPDGTLPGPPLQVGCVDSVFCVIALSRRDFSNVILYTNASPPRFTAGTQPVVIDERSGPVPVQVLATDDDGDAVRVTADATAAAGVLDVGSVAQPDQLELRLTSREVCQDETRVVRLFASDGLRAHDLEGGVSVRVVNRQGPAAPGVTPTSASTFAGGASRRFTAEAGAGLCPTVGYRWSGTPELVTNGSATATFNPPAVLCQPQGATYEYTVEALDQGGVPSAPTRFTVDVAPWGAPRAPFRPDAVLTLTAGLDAGVDVVPEALHDCTGTPGLPPVETQWRPGEPGAGVPMGLTVRAADGGTVLLAPPVVSERLRVEAAACTRASLSLIARNRVTTDAGGVQEGPESRVRVDVVPLVEDIATTQLNMAVVPAGDGGVDLQLGTSLLCPGEYRIQARLSLRDLDGGPLSDDAGVVDVPGSWRLPLSPSCSVQDYIVRGALFEVRDGIQREGATAETRVSTQALEPALGALEGEPLEARCGEGAKATLTQAIPSNACSEVSLSWTQVAGPELQEVALSGKQVTVATRDTGLEALVGKSIVLRVTASVGDGRAAATEHVLPITTAPFVDVAHETESPTGSEKGLVGVVARLSNTSECRVGGLVHRERVEGGEWVPGSVKLDGQPVVERAVEGGFEVDGVTLGAGATGTLTYVVRPALLGSPRFGGEVFLNQVLVSGLVPGPSTSGCGCSGGGSGVAVLGLVALARLLRRRRAGASG
jgi:uncharacterized protein (TIGR03382 family)